MMRRKRVVVLLAVCAVAGIAFITRHSSLVALGHTLVCEQSTPTAGAALLDNVDSDFGLFRRGAELQRGGLASRVLVPLMTSKEPDTALAAQEAAAAFARVAGLSRWDIIPVRDEEPISLHAAYRVRDFLLRERISSVTLVTNGFRSRRSELIYRSVLDEHGIAFGCLPVFGTTNPDTWTGTWHGIQDVGLQFLKLQYYRFWVLPLAQ